MKHKKLRLLLKLKAAWSFKTSESLSVYKASHPTILESLATESSCTVVRKVNSNTILYRGIRIEDKALHQSDRLIETSHEETEVEGL